MIERSDSNDSKSSLPRIVKHHLKVKGNIKTSQMMFDKLVQQKKMRKKLRRNHPINSSVDLSIINKNKVNFQVLIL